MGHSIISKIKIVWGIEDMHLIVRVWGKGEFFFQNFKFWKFSISFWNDFAKFGEFLGLDFCQLCSNNNYRDWHKK